MKNHSAPVYTFKQFNDEINDFYKHLKENKFTDEEIKKLFAPLNTETKRMKLVVTVTLVSLLILTSLYFLTSIETISWHFSALGRIFLIKLLPFWDWTVLKNEKCLIPKTATTITEITFNCDLCENINQIDVYDDISEEILKNRYLDLDLPVIVKKPNENWPNSVDFIDTLMENSKIIESKPCSLSTNIYNGIPTVKNLLLRTNMFDSFFLHFQNCDFQIMKQFRSYTPRPSFLPPELSPIQYNWLLWSKNYNVSNFKSVGLVDKLALVGQIVGSNSIRLLPRNNCELDCPQIDIKLNPGESIIFSSLWNLQYRPDYSENIAVILEMH